MGVGCRCRIPDWRRFRVALGLTQRDLAELLCISTRHVRRLETIPHHCPSAASVMLLRAWLRHPEYRRRLEVADYAHPFPEDLEDLAHAW